MPDSTEWTTLVKSKRKAACWPFELSPLNVLYRGTLMLMHSITLVPFEIC